MNIVEEFRADAERVLDRLVDGEIGREDRRRLLAALDDEPGAWRQCALAFLESQQWREQLGGVATRPAATVEAEPKSTAASVLPANWQAWLVLAASVLVAFGLGLITPQRAPTIVADARPTLDASFGDEDQFDSITLTLADNDNRVQTFKVPIIEADDDFSETWLAQHESQLPESLSQIEELGYDVAMERTYFPVELEDGRQVLVPIDDVVIHQRVY